MSQPCWLAGRPRRGRQAAQALHPQAGATGPGLLMNSCRPRDVWPTTAAPESDSPPRGGPVSCSARVTQSTSTMEHGGRHQPPVDRRLPAPTLRDAAAEGRLLEAFGPGLPLMEGAGASRDLRWPHYQSAEPPDVYVARADDGPVAHARGPTAVVPRAAIAERRGMLRIREPRACSPAVSHCITALSAASSSSSRARAGPRRSWRSPTSPRP